MPEAVSLVEAGFGATCAILSVEYESTMNDACHLRRKNMAENRASALEQAFDFALAKGTKREWERTGEVFLDRDARRVRAFCVRSDELYEGAMRERRGPSADHNAT